MERALLDATPIPMVAFRDRRVIYANRAVAELVGTPMEALLGRPFTDFVPPDDVSRIQERHLARLAGLPVPTVYEATLLTATGVRVPVEVHAGFAGGVVFLQLEDITDRAVYRFRLTLLAQLGVELQEQRTEEAILGAVRDALPALDLSSVLVTPQGGELGLSFIQIHPDLLRDLEAAAGAPLVSLTRPSVRKIDHVWEHGAAFIEDWPDLMAEFFGGALGERARALNIAGGLTRGIGVRIDEAGAPKAMLLVMGSWLRPEDLPAFRLFGAQATAALDAARSIRDLSRRNAEFAALNRIAGIATSAGDLQSFLADALQVVAQTTGCDVAGVWLLGDGGRQLVLAREEGATGAGPRERARVLAEPGIGGRVTGDGNPAVWHAEDHPAELRDRFAQLGFETVAAVPLVSRSATIGVLVTWHGVRRSADECRLALLQAMGAHFATSIEEQRLLGDLRRRVSELTLLNDVAVASATLDPVLLLDNALRRIRATFEADTGGAFLMQDGALVRTTAVGISDETRRRVDALPTTGSPAALAIERRKPVLVACTDAGAARSQVLHDAEGVETAVAVPLVVKDRALGAFVIGRRSPRPFAESEVSLLAALGVQLGVAVENARLFADTRRRLGDLEAVSGLALRMFETPPGDTHALLEASCREIGAALGARGVVVLRVNDAWSELRGTAGWGTPLPPIDLVIRLADSPLAEQALATREAVWTDDIASDLQGSGAAHPDHPHLSMLLVPLVSRRTTRGLVAIADAPGRRFSAAEVALATALAREAAMGLENAELFAETRQRAEELGLLHEVGRSLVASLELNQVLDAGVRNFARIVDAPEAYLALADESRTRLEVRAATGAHPELVGHVSPIEPREATLISSLVFHERAPIAIEDAERDPRVRSGVRELTGARAYLGLPLTVRDRVIGSAVVVETRGPRRFTPPEVDRAAAIANQLAVAVENARLYEDLRRSYAELARAQQQLIRQERLAALGELAAVVAHEVRNPLAVIFNSLGSLRRLLRPQGDARMLFDIVGEEADRLNRIVGDLLDFARPTTPALQLEPVDRVIAEAITAALPESGAIELRREIDPALPPVPMDARLLRQCLLNLTLNAVQAMPRGGVLSVAARLDDGAAAIDVGDTGPGIPEELRHRIFEPFFTTKATGTGLGLAVVKRIVDGHGGEVQVKRNAAQGTTFTVRLPLSAPGVGSEAAPASRKTE